MVYVGKEIEQTIQEKDVYIIPFTPIGVYTPKFNLLVEVKDVMDAVEKLRNKLKEEYKTRRVEIEPLKINLVVK